MRAEDLMAALERKVGNAALELADAQAAAGRAQASLDDTRATVASCIGKGFAADHVAIVEALVEPDEAGVAAAAAALDAASAWVGAAQLAVADVGARHVELQSAGAAGEVYQGVAAGPGTAPADGRAAGGEKGAVRPVLAGARGVAEVSAATAIELKRISGRDVAVDMAGSDLQVAREHCEGVLRAAEHAPHVRVTSVLTYGPGGARPARADESNNEYANARGDELSSIGFNTHWAADPEAYRASLEEDGRNRGAINRDPIGVGVHECGHLVSHQAPSSHPFAGGVEFDAMDLALQRSGGWTGRYREYVTEKISFCASWERGELTAEAFADVVLNEAGASDLSHDIYQMLTRPNTGATVAA